VHRQEEQVGRAEQVNRFAMREVPAEADERVPRGSLHI
jgi:hypothetical protein